MKGNSSCLYSATTSTAQPPAGYARFSPESSTNWRIYGAKMDIRYSICNQKCFNARPTQLLNTFTSDVEDQASALILNKNINNPEATPRLFVKANSHRETTKQTNPQPLARWERQDSFPVALRASSPGCLFLSFWVCPF